VLEWGLEWVFGCDRAPGWRSPCRLGIGRGDFGQFHGLKTLDALFQEFCEDEPGTGH
jgi:hypothetical protein